MSLDYLVTVGKLICCCCVQERPPIPSDMPEAYANLMMSSWSPDPFQRPSFGVILEQLQDMLARVVQGEQDAQDRFVSDL